MDSISAFTSGKGRMVVLLGGALVLAGVVVAARSLAATGPRLSNAACGSISTKPKITIEWPTEREAPSA